MAAAAGSDRFYGILDAFTNPHHPHRLTEDNHVVEIDQYPEGYHLTDDLTDRCIDMVREPKASNPAKPFFTYFCPIRRSTPRCTPGPRTSLAQGRYDAGWDVIRQQRYERQVAMARSRGHAAGAPQHRAEPRRAAGTTCPTPSTSCSPATWRFRGMVDRTTRTSASS